jgi:hypothetical protein
LVVADVAWTRAPSIVMASGLTALAARIARRTNDPVPLGCFAACAIIAIAPAPDAGW